jgi:hypothetical protein
MGRFCDDGEVGAEIGLGRPVWEISDEQTDCQNFLVKAGKAAAPSRGARF